MLNQLTHRKIPLFFQDERKVNSRVALQGLTQGTLGSAVFYEVLLKEAMTRVVGIVAIQKPVTKGSPAYISLLLIDVDFRGRGLGHEVNLLLDKELAQFSDTILLHVSPPNPGLIAFWKSNGFVTVGGLQEMMGLGQTKHTGALMQKRLHMTAPLGITH
ncbi:acetyltransferase (GNAT) family protein [Acidovorax sp. 69]|uniref:GNAT family N-acetyltransferase n=1 Tax=Acidovorax sp. 69 TaxID=2035202 RepID=UPI000C230B97|nr:GNAT family N-acetyltransferase [Acidovorax sp. 69]PJI97824.1 acetyltransferase (GNAT) family protein [Acidovorax sp. 69]